MDDSLDFNYGTQKVDPASYEAFLENEKSNFKLLLSKVRVRDFKSCCNLKETKE